jgi:hypothetical protein
MGMHRNNFDVHSRSQPAEEQFLNGAVPMGDCHETVILGDQDEIMMGDTQQL